MIRRILKWLNRLNPNKSKCYRCGEYKDKLKFPVFLTSDGALNTDLYCNECEGKPGVYVKILH
jgi:hypothetical protein